MKKKIFQIFIVLLITTSCGFKVYNQADLINFSAEEIRTTGDARINYNLKNKLISSLKNESTCCAESSSIKSYSADKFFSMKN